MNYIQDTSRKDDVEIKLESRKETVSIYLWQMFISLPAGACHGE